MQQEFVILFTSIWFSLYIIQRIFDDGKPPPGEGKLELDLVGVWDRLLGKSGLGKIYLRFGVCVCVCDTREARFRKFSLVSIVCE